MTLWISNVVSSSKVILDQWMFFKTACIDRIQRFWKQLSLTEGAFFEVRIRSSAKFLIERLISEYIAEISENIVSFCYSHERNGTTYGAHAYHDLLRDTYVSLVTVLDKCNYTDMMSLLVAEHRKRWELRLINSAMKCTLYDNAWSNNELFLTLYQSSVCDGDSIWNHSHDLSLWNNICNA